MPFARTSQPESALHWPMCALRHSSEQEVTCKPLEELQQLSLRTSGKQFSGAVGRCGANTLPVLQEYMHHITHFVIKLGNASENFKKYHIGIADIAITTVDIASHLEMQKHLLDYWYSPTLISHKLCSQVDLILKGIKFLTKTTYST